jgi:uncharacterized membrane protein YidH (DUF202 family)
MAKKIKEIPRELPDKNTELSEKRTEMAYERTVLAYLRTSATIILFGVAFLGFAETRSEFLFYAGIVSISVGVFFGFIAFHRGLVHLKEINRIKEYFLYKIIGRRR